MTDLHQVGRIQSRLQKASSLPDTVGTLLSAGRPVNRGG